MGRKGPAPLPLEVKRRRGTYRPDRAPAREVVVVPGAPAMPRHLGAAARAKWRELVPQLLDMGLLTPAYRTSLELLCSAYEEYREAAAMIRREGLVLESQRAVKVNGVDQVLVTRKPHPARAARDSAWGRYTAMMREFGLSPSAKGRVDLSGVAPPPPSRRRPGPRRPPPRGCPMSQAATSPATSKGTESGAVHPAAAFALDVVEGRVLAGKFLRLACERHLRDLRDGAARGIHFDAGAADRAVAFFPNHLRHSKGELGGTPLHLAPWQVFIVASLFGWRRADGLRRFRQAFIETGKKSGKSTLVAGISILATFFDSPKEPGAEGYCAATKKEQAKAVWKEARSMVMQSPELRRAIRVWGGTRENSVGSLEREDVGSTLKPLTKDPKGLEGINPHFVSADEVHAWDGRDLWDVLKMSSSSRRQPLMVAITNTGTDTTSLWYALRERAARVLEGGEQDDSLFAVICCIDKGDDWRDELVWVKANPGLGISVKVEEVRALRDEALTTPSAVNPFRRYYCGEIVAADEAAFDMEKWRACTGPWVIAVRRPVVDLAALRGRTCFGGLDLASSIDLTALVLVFPPLPTERWRLLRVLTWVWAPEETLAERCRTERIDYFRWRDEGHLLTTPGATTDYAFVRKVIEEQAKLYRIVELGYDRMGADETRGELEKAGIPMVDVRQGHLSLSAACKHLEGEYLSYRLVHYGHPVLSWMAGNVVWRRDPNNNFIPDKGKAAKKRKHIDGVSALVTALSRVIASPKGKPSAYGPGGARESGLLVIGQRPATPAGGVA